MVTIEKDSSHVSMSAPLKVAVTAVPYGVDQALGDAVGASLTATTVIETFADAVPPWPSATV